MPKYIRLKNRSKPIEIKQIQNQLRLLFLDESTASLDARSQGQVINDLHNDQIEKESEHRSEAHIPLDIALISMESKLIHHGVTSIFHSMASHDDDSAKKIQYRYL